MTLNEQIINEIVRKGLSSIQGAFYNQVSYWRQWYQSFVPEFHLYNVTLANGTTTQKEKLSMNLAKKVCEDMSKLLWSNKVQINLDTPEKTEQLWEILEENNFNVMFPRQLELCSALGTVAFIEYLQDGKPFIEYIGEADRIIPFQYSANRITGFLTVNRFTKIEMDTIMYYTLLTFHEFVDNNYIKYNMIYKSKVDTELGEELVFTSIYPNDKEQIIVPNVEYPYFQILKFPIVNNYDLNNPLGISIFGNSIDRLKSLDTKFDSFYNEFICGKKRILIDASALKGLPEADDQGNVTTTLYFDKNDSTYVALRGMEQQPIKDIDFNLRYQEHIESIQAEINWLSSNVGFGENFYSFNGSKPMTATEVISNDSDAYRTKENYDVVVVECVENIVRAICNLAGIQTEEIEVITDFSRFKNDSTEQQRLMQEVNSGITSKVEYRMKVYNEDEITARKKIEEIDSNEPDLDELMGTVEDENNLSES